MKIILWLSIVWLLPFLYFVQNNEAKFKKNIVVGVTLPNEAHEDSDVLALLDKYKKENLIITVILGVAIVPCLIPKDFTWILFAWMLWLDAVIIFTQVPFVKYNKKLKDLKKEKGWAKRNLGKDSTATKSKETVVVNTSNITIPKWVSPWVFGIAFLITLIPLCFNINMWPIVLTMALTQITFYLVYRYAFRKKSEAIDENVDLTIALTQMRRRYWGRTWINVSFATAVYSLCILLLQTHPGLYLWTTIFYSVYVLFAVAVPEFKVRSLQEKLTEGSGTEKYVDEDDNWIWGMFYYNPKDSHFMVNGRVGTGTTMNIAKPFGKFMCVFVIFILVLMPAFPFMLNSAIDSDVIFSREDNAVIVSCGKSEFKVDLDKIESVEFIDEYPEDLYRNWGTATDKILKGSFSAKEIGPISVCLNPGYEPYILIKMQNRKAFLFGTDDVNKTKELYDLLTLNE